MMKTRLSFLTFLVCSISFLTKAQNIPVQLDSISQSSLEIGLNYSSNSGIYGIYNNITNQPVTAADFFYSGKKGLSLGISGLIIGNSDGASLSKSSSEVDLTAGWDLSLFNNSLTISPSYSRFIFSSGLATEKSMFTDQTGIDLSGSFNWFKPSLTADYLFGVRNALNINFSLGFEGKIYPLAGSENSLSFDPSVGLNYGNLSLSNFLPKNLFSFLSPLRATYGDNSTIQQLLANTAIVKKKAVQKQLAGLNPNATLGELFSGANAYQFNSLDINLPVTYTVRNLAVFSEISVSKPLNVPSYFKSKTIVFFSAGISYSFNL